MFRFAALFREFASAATFAFVAALAAATGAAAQTPTTGIANPAFAAVDQAITNWMTTYAIPGGTVAVAYNGNIVYSRGYGYANANTGIETQPDTLFRTASLSKADCRRDPDAG